MHNLKWKEVESIQKNWKLDHISSNERDIRIMVLQLTSRGSR